MKKLTVKYDRKDFFGRGTYTEDSTEWVTLKEAKKAFQFLGRENDVTVEIDYNDGQSILYFWGSVTDHENGVITVRTYKAWNSYTDGKKAFTAAKKAVYDELR